MTRKTGAKSWPRKNSARSLREQTSTPLALFNQVVHSSVAQHFADDDEGFHHALNFTETVHGHMDDATAHLVCCPYDDAVATVTKVRKKLAQGLVKTVHASRSTGWTCFIVTAAPSTLRVLRSIGTIRHIQPLPCSAKTAGSFTDLFQGKDEVTLDGLHVHLSPGAMPSGPTSEDWTGELWARWRSKLLGAVGRRSLHEHVYWASAGAQRRAASLSVGGGAYGEAVRHWSEAVKAATAHGDGGCGWSRVEAVRVRDSMLQLSQVDHLSQDTRRAPPRNHRRRGAVRDHSCLMALVGFLAAQPEVMHIAPQHRMRTRNYVSGSVTQSGKIGTHALWDIGINGTGQVVGLSDTGLDERSCFFRDDVNGLVAHSSEDKPTFALGQRKVVQYIDYSGNGQDGFHGHGTMTAGSVAGYPTGDLSSGASSCTATYTCFGDCLTDAQCITASQASGEYAPLIDMTGHTKCSQVVGDDTFDWEFYCPAHDCDGLESKLEDTYPCLPDAPELLSEAAGIAPGAKIAFFDIGKGTTNEDLSTPTDLTVMLSPAYDAGARTYSISWGPDTLTECPPYSDQEVTIDTFTYSNPDFLVVLAAGNTGDLGYCTSSSPANAKNGVGVGATESGPTRLSQDLDSVAYFSSLGPTYDYRLKPDVVTPGYFMISAAATFPGTQAETCAATAAAGTSFSCPIVAGAAALVREYFERGFYAADLKTQDLCGTDPYNCTSIAPTAALVKAVLISASSPLANGISTPNVYEGHGRLDLSSTLPLGSTSLNLFVAQGSLGSGDSVYYTVTVGTAGAAEGLKMTLVWTDPPALVSSASQVLHDLDLLVVGPGCAAMYPNGLSSPDTLNNVEKVYLNSTSLEAGTYAVQVTAHQLTESETQNFALVIAGAGVVASATGLSSTCKLLAAAAITVPEGVLKAWGVELQDNCYEGCCVDNFEWIGNGYCDDSIGNTTSAYNTAACGYDGGDCCPWTCDSTSGNCGRNGYQCQDPKFDSCTATNFNVIGNGVCDDGVENTLACGYDLGDCCTSCCNPIAYTTLNYASQVCPDTGCCKPSASDCLDPTCASSKAATQPGTGTGGLVRPPDTPTPGSSIQPAGASGSGGGGSGPDKTTVAIVVGVVVGALIVTALFIIFAVRRKYTRAVVHKPPTAVAHPVQEWQQPSRRAPFSTTAQHPQLLDTVSYSNGGLPVHSMSHSNGGSHVNSMNHSNGGAYVYDNGAATGGASAAYSAYPVHTQYNPR